MIYSVKQAERGRKERCGEGGWREFGGERGPTLGTLKLQIIKLLNKVTSANISLILEHLVAGALSFKDRIFDI